MLTRLLFEGPSFPL